MGVVEGVKGKEREGEGGRDPIPFHLFLAVQSFSLFIPPACVV